MMCYTFLEYAIRSLSSFSFFRCSYMRMQKVFPIHLYLVTNQHKSPSRLNNAIGSFFTAYNYCSLTISLSQLYTLDCNVQVINFCFVSGFLCFRVTQSRITLLSYLKHRERHNSSLSTKYVNCLMDHSPVQIIISCKS